MTMRLLGVAAAALLAITAVRPVAAHHAFGSEFDANAPVLLKGKIVKIEWVNPHTWIHVEVTNKDGQKEVWMVEGGSPNTLLRRGANKNTFPDGRKLFLGSTGTGAPYDETDKPKSDKQ